MIGVAFGVGIGITIMLFFEYRYKKLYELEKSCTKRLEERVKSLENTDKTTESILQRHSNRINILEQRTGVIMSCAPKSTPKVNLTIDGVNYEVRGGYGNGVL